MGANQSRPGGSRRPAPAGAQRRSQDARRGCGHRAAACGRAAEAAAPAARTQQPRQSFANGETAQRLSALAEQVAALQDMVRRGDARERELREALAAAQQAASCCSCGALCAASQQRAGAGAQQLAPRGSCGQTRGGSSMAPVAPPRLPVPAEPLRLADPPQSPVPQGAARPEPDADRNQPGAVPMQPLRTRQPRVLGRLGRAVSRCAARCRRLVAGRRAARDAEERAPLLGTPDPAPEAATESLGATPATMYRTAYGEEVHGQQQVPTHSGPHLSGELLLLSAAQCERRALAGTLEGRALRRLCRTRYGCWRLLLQQRQRSRGALSELRQRGREETMQHVLGIDNINHRVAAFVPQSYAPVRRAAAEMVSLVALYWADLWYTTSDKILNNRISATTPCIVELQQFRAQLLQTLGASINHRNPAPRRFVRRVNMQLLILRIYHIHLSDLVDEFQDMGINMTRTGRGLLRALVRRPRAT
eukprot:TRINITY_DN10057_c0_g1_i7.p1 TRINITY_DN10057_c0_g1~~TRINITY_DN10057_c0_g1_i7.p1  ORF type:complete len:505 (+),score=96.36 TRINITY_DN10057_c0_g1_i7:82-1515(+)